MMSSATQEQMENRLEKPAAFPLLLITLACRVLSGGDMRRRYQEEFRAELYGMPRLRQTGHALRVVGSSLSLRRATRDPARGRRRVFTILRSKPLLCLLNLHHYWQWQSTPDGERLERCALCDKDRTENIVHADPATWM